MILLRVSYKVRAHHVAQFEEVFVAQVRPLIFKHGLQLNGIWRTLVGSVGEYMELWEFDSVAEFDQRWRALMTDPELIKIFETTGPWVEDETFTLMEPAVV